MNRRSKGALKYLMRESTRFLRIGFLIFSILFVLAFISGVLSNARVEYGGLDSGLFLMTFIAAIQIYRKALHYFTQNSISRTQTGVYLILHALLNAFILAAAVFVLRMIGSALVSLPFLKSYIFLSWLINPMQDGIFGWVKLYVLCVMIAWTIHLLALVLSAVNYNLNGWARVVFWFLFVMYCAVLYAVMNVPVDALHTLPLWIRLIAVPVCDFFRWIMQGENFFLGFPAMAGFFGILFFLLVKNQEIRYKV